MQSLIRHVAEKPKGQVPLACLLAGTDDGVVIYGVRLLVPQAPARHVSEERQGRLPLAGLLTGAEAALQVVVLGSRC